MGTVIGNSRVSGNRLRWRRYRIIRLDILVNRMKPHKEECQDDLNGTNRVKHLTDYEMGIGYGMRISNKTRGDTAKEIESGSNIDDLFHDFNVAKRNA